MRWALLLLGVCGLIVAGRPAVADDADLAAIKAANQAFYSALSARDLKAMQAVWADRAYVTNIGPRSKVALVGYDEAVTKYWSTVFETFSRMSVAMTAVIGMQSDGRLAWVVGQEAASLQLKGGDLLQFDNFVTNLFEKIGGRWLMISHHAQMIPK
jgi:ketosteroid isomerase-like protein